MGSGIVVHTPFQQTALVWVCGSFMCGWWWFAAYDLSGGLLNPALALARGILNDDPEGATSHIFCEVIAGLTATGIFWGLKLQDVGGGGGYEAAPQNEC